MEALGAGRFEVAGPAEDDRLWAWDRKTGAKVLIRVVEDTAALRRSLRRARRIRHAGLARICAVVRDRGRLAVAYEPVQGERPETPLAAERAQVFAQDLCAALAAAHAAGVVHGALTLDAVRIADGRAVVLDVGIGQGRAGRRLDPRVDVLGLGTVLYQAHTGARPFEVPPDGLPQTVRAPLLRCLQPDPGRRWRSVAEVARALGVEAVPRRARRRPGWLVFGSGAMVVLALALATLFFRPSPAPNTASVRVAAPAPPVQTTPTNHAVVVRTFVAGGEQAWLGRGLREMIVKALKDTAGVEVVGAGPAGEVARNAGVDSVLEGSVQAGPEGDGLTIQAKLLDVRSGALRLAERLQVESAEAAVLLADELAAKIRRALGAGAEARPITQARVGAGAWQAYVEALAAGDGGDEGAAEVGFRHAVALDERFLEPRLALVALLRRAGRVVDAEREIEAARRLDPGGRGASWLDVHCARDPKTHVLALEGLRQKQPRDPAVALELAAVYRAAGRGGDCLAEARRAAELGAVGAERELAWCSLLAGDRKAALEHAHRAGGEPLGDVLLMTGRYGEAQKAYDQVRSVRAALVDLHGRGRCRRAAKLARAATMSDQPALRVPDAVTIWARADLACGDVSGAREAIELARQRAPDLPAAEDLMIELQAFRGAAGAWEQGAARASQADLQLVWFADRAGRWGAALAAARTSVEAKAALAAVSPPEPVDRYALMAPPLLLQVALLRISLGDLEEAELACAELRDAAPGYAPGHYCSGRVLEAQGKWSLAFGEYRAFLDAWAEADPENVLFRDGRGRLKAVIQRAR